MRKELVMYSRSSGCPAVRVAKRILDEHKVPYREVYIDKSEQANQRLKIWTGFGSVPTLVVSREGEEVPIQEPRGLVVGESPRGKNRGSMISEPNGDELKDWLREQGFID